MNVASFCSLIIQHIHIRDAKNVAIQSFCGGVLLMEFKNHT